MTPPQGVVYYKIDGLRSIHAGWGTMIHELSLELRFGNFAGLPPRHQAVLTRARVRRWVGMALRPPI